MLNMQHHSQASVGREGGVMLLEALIAILIFSIGILGLVAMQGLAISAVSDAKYRSDASFLANQIMAQIWVDRGNVANYVVPGGAAPALVPWLANVQAELPSGAATISIPPPGYPAGAVEVLINWQQPGNASIRAYRALTIVSNP
jgi:type IV pilus assembly protein PilV